MEKKVSLPSGGPSVQTFLVLWRFQWVRAVAGLVSKSETLKVAVGFSPRMGSVKRVRRGATFETRLASSGFQASLLDANVPARFRGLKPTATIMESLRDRKASRTGSSIHSNCRRTNSAG